jgi:uncharacterized membrane protein YqhA
LRTLYRDEPRLFWLVIVHLSFVVSGVLLALTDWLNGQVAKH